MTERWARDKRSKASELQRVQLVAEPTVETKSKKINLLRDLQQLSGCYHCRTNTLSRKNPNLDCDGIFTVSVFFCSKQQHAC